MSSLLLLGAGASYGSDSGGTPPLGQNLADALCKFNPEGWGALPRDILAEFRIDFEQGMINVSAKNPHHVPILQRAMAKYFFQFVPKTTNLYVRLAQLMKNIGWKGAICTLNYERYIELCVLHVGLQPVFFEPTNSGTTIEFCFPHGCCHFFCDSVMASAQGVSFSGLNVQTNGNVRVISDPAEFSNRIHNDAFPPVMSYFEPRKRTTSGVNFIEGQRQRFEELARGADNIIIIGVRVRKHDAHIWNPLKNSSAKIVYCGGNEGGAEFIEWSKTERPEASDLMLNGYFFEQFDSIVVNPQSLVQH